MDSSEFEVDVVVRTPREALRLLNRLHGWENGEAPLDVVPTDEHRTATYRLMIGRVVRIRVTFDRDGNRTFELSRGYRAGDRTEGDRNT
jgi:hypothetical protein